jgi:hypothetical protein
MERLDFIGPKLSCNARRMYAGSKQSFRSVDVSQTGDPVLIHQEGLDGQSGIGKELRQAFHRELALQRLDAETAELFLDARVYELERAQTTRIDEGQLSAAGQLHEDTYGTRHGLCRTADNKLTAHTEVGCHLAPLADVPDEILAASRHLSNLRTPKRSLHEPHLLPAEHSRVQNPTVQDAPSSNPALEVLTGNLDFRKLGHPPSPYEL